MMRWDGANALENIRREMNRRLLVAAKVLANEMKEVLSVPAPRVRLTNAKGATFYVAGWGKGGPGVNRVAYRTTYVKNKKTGKLEGRMAVYETSPATPGAPPRKLSGRLRASIASELDANRMSAAAGTNVVYGRRHEFNRHPWASVAVEHTRAELERIVGAGAISPPTGGVA